MPDDRLQVDGPLAGPFKTKEDLATHACALMTSQPGAANGKAGFEYCALYYYSNEDSAYFLSYLSDFGGNKAGGKKFCEVPRALNELGRRNAILLGPAHNHPINRKFSPEDLGLGQEQGWSPLGAARFVDKESGRIWDRELMAFYKEGNGACSIYLYNYSTRVVSALREGRWLPIGKAEGVWGDFKSFEGRDWLP